MVKRIYTSESVTEGHPDKICDLIVDSILDSFLEKDAFTRADCGALATHGLVVISGEVTTRCYIDLTGLVRETLLEIGYDSPELGFDYRTVGVLPLIQEQSDQVGRVVDMRKAGDHGIMVGFATDEAKHLGSSLDYMPIPIAIAHRLMKQLAEARKKKSISYLRPDGKGQVTVEYNDGTPARISSVVIAAQHDPDVDQKQLREDVTAHVIQPVFKTLGIEIPMDTLHINPGGPFIEGGPQYDTGESGRKIVVDSYGSHSRHGGSSFSGKDPTKIDRAGAYFARYLAKNVVASEIASKCEIQLAYYYGNPEPVSIAVDTLGTGLVDDERITALITEHFDLSPAGIIEKLDLRRPIYRPTACYGHFGRSEYGFSWEQCDAKDLFAELRKGRKSK